MIFIFQRTRNSYNQSVIMTSHSLLITTLCLALLSPSLAQIMPSDCMTGEYYDYNVSNCVPCDISCAQCSSADGCSQCYDQMYLMPVGNKVVCEICYKFLQGCTVCSSAYKCATCSNGFYLLTNNTCNNCSKFMPNCALCYYDNSTNVTQLLCLACASPSILVDGVCSGNSTSNSSQNSSGGNDSNGGKPPTTPSSNNSAQTSSSQTSQNNNANQSPNTNTNNQGTTPPNNSANSQPVCDSNFILVGQVCTRIIPFCNQYNTNSLKCDVCAPTYSKSDQGYCLPDILLINSNTNQASTTSTASTQSTSSTNSNGSSSGNSNASNSGNNGNNSGSNNGNNGNNQGNNGNNSGNSGNGNSGGCQRPCQTCAAGRPSACVTCIEGYTIVDAIPETCYAIN